MYYLFRLARFLSVTFPRKVAYAVATVASRVKYYCSHKDRRAVIANLAPLIADRKEASRIAKKIFENFALYLVDFFSISKLSDAFMKEYVTIEGSEYLSRVREENKAVVLISAHIGNYELGACVTSYLGFPLYVVALPHKDTRVNDFFNHQRGTYNVNVIPTGIAVKKCIKVLTDKVTVAILGDRRFSVERGVPVTLLGQTVRLPKGPAFFAARTQSAFVPCFLMRVNRYSYRMIYDKPIYVPDMPKKEALAWMMQQYASVLEKHIRAYPDQWYVFEHYWVP